MLCFVFQIQRIKNELCTKNATQITIETSQAVKPQDNRVLFLNDVAKVYHHLHPDSVSRES